MARRGASRARLKALRKKHKLGEFAKSKTGRRSRHSVKNSRVLGRSQKRRTGPTSAKGGATLLSVFSSYSRGVYDLNRRADQAEREQQ